MAPRVRQVVLAARDRDAVAPRVRQVVLAARDRDAVASALRAELGLDEPYSDPAVGYFGLHNVVFALGDTFLEVVSPLRADTAAGRLLERRGGDCGYMVMFQVDDLDAARDRAAAAGIREVFEVSLEEIEEVHLHPADMGGAIVSLSTPRPADAWRWGGPGWQERSAPLRVGAVTIEVPDPDQVAARWREVIGELRGVRFEQNAAGRGLVEVLVQGADGRQPAEIGGVRFVFDSTEENHD